MMEMLDLKDKKILYELDQNSRQPSSKIAKKVGLPASVVNYRINRLATKGVIKRFVTIINYARFGLATYKVYLQFQGLSREKEEELVDYLMKNPKINYIAKYSGQWDLVFAVYTKSVADFSSIMDNFLNQYSTFILNKVITILVDVEIYKRDYLLNKQGTGIAKFGSDASEIKISPTELRILKMLQSNARESAIEMAKKLSTTVRIIGYKIKQLEKKGIIIAYRIDLDHKLLGLEFYKVFIQTHNYTGDKDMRFRAYCHQLPNCLHLVKCIGNWEYELEFEVKNYTECNNIIKNIRAEFGDFIRTMQTVLIEKEYKFEFL